MHKFYVTSIPLFLFYIKGKLQEGNIFIVIFKTQDIFPETDHDTQKGPASYE